MNPNMKPSLRYFHLMAVSGALFLAACEKVPPISQSTIEAEKKNQQLESEIAQLKKQLNQQPISSQALPTEKASSPPPPQFDATDQEALALAHKLFTEKGDTIFIARPFDGYVHYTEMKGVEKELKKQPISEADKLNGIDWRGAIYISCAARRTHGNVVNGGIDKSWSAWEDMKDRRPFRIQIARQKGRWSVVPQQPAMFDSYEDVKIVRQNIESIPISH